MAAKANNLRCSLWMRSLRRKVKSIAVKNIVATTKRRNMVAVGLRFS